MPGREASLAATGLDESMTPVELFSGERRLDLDAPGAASDGVRLGRAEQGRSNPSARSDASHVHRRSVPGTFDLIIAGKAENQRRALDGTGRDEEHLSALHGIEVQTTRQPLLPGVDDIRRIEPGADRANG